MNQPNITERQRQWRYHVLAAASFDGTIVEYAKANSLKTKDTYQWKTLLTKRGFLPMPPEGQATNFVAVQSSSDRNDAVETLSFGATYRITLPRGAVFELFSPIIVAELPKLLAAIQSR